MRDGTRRAAERRPVERRRADGRDARRSPRGVRGTWAATRPIRSAGSTPLRRRRRRALHRRLRRRARRPSPASAAVVLFPFPPATPDVDLAATVVEARADGGSVAIPPGGAVLVRAGPRRGARAGGPVGTSLDGAARFVPLARLVAAIGGGPQLVRDGQRSSARTRGSRRSSSARAPRGARSASSPTGGSSSSRSTAGSPGTASGLTNFELAQALVRLGAVTGMALDSGGSTTMAFDGALLNRPSDGRERPSRPR